MNKWPEEKMNLLREMYPNEDVGKDEIVARIGKTWDAIKSMAKTHKIRRGGPRGEVKRWADEDFEMFKHLYLEEKLSEEELIGRMGISASSMRNMVHRLGVSRERIDSWDEGELETLRTIYSDHRMSNDDILSALPRRSMSAIYTKACETRLERKWTEEEISLLTILFPSDISDDDLLSSFPGRTWWSLVCKAGGLGLKRPKDPNPHFWSEEQLRLLKKNFGNVEKSRDDLVALIGRSWDVIRHRAKREGLVRIEPDTEEKKEYRRERGRLAGAARSLSTTKEWTDEEDALLRKVYQDAKISWEEIERRMERSKASIKGRVKKLGLRRPCKEYSVVSDYFDEVDTAEKAYWLGFIAADGSVSDAGTLKIDLNCKDEAHLKLFRDTIAPDAEVKIPTNRPDKVVLAVSDVALCKGLKRYGIVPRKTCSLEWPAELNEEFYIPFIAGYFDGDGTLIRYKGKLIFRVLGTKKLLERMREIAQDKIGIEFPPVRFAGWSPMLFYFGKTGAPVEKIDEVLCRVPVRLWRKTLANM